VWPRLDGKKVAHIAKELGIGRGSVYRALADYNGLFLASKMISEPQLSLQLSLMALEVHEIERAWPDGKASCDFHIPGERHPPVLR